MSECDCGSQLDRESIAVGGIWIGKKSTILGLKLGTGILSFGYKFVNVGLNWWLKII